MAASSGTIWIMADIKFACPHCSQHITCDSLWAGHQLECPSCKNPLMVPAPAAPAAAAAAAPPPPPPPSSLTPKVPAAVQPRLSLGKAQSPHAAEAAASGAPAQKNIPIRNLAPPPPAKGNIFLKILKVAGGIAVAGGVAYCGFILVHHMQEKANAERKADEARNSGESQAGHIANLNAVLDATEPGRYGSRPSRLASTRSINRAAGVAGVAPGATGDDEDSSSGPGATAGTAGPIVPPTWTLDLAAAKIPAGRANGKISGSNFVVEVGSILPSSGAQVLRLTQGSAMAPDREVFIYLHPKPGEKLGGQSMTVSSDQKMGVPSVTKRWKVGAALQSRSFTSGYAMKLEWSAPTNGTLPGKIFLALPDPEQSVVAGAFTINLPSADAMMAPAAQPVPTAGNPAAMDSFRKRYGVGR